MAEHCSQLENPRPTLLVGQTEARRTYKWKVWRGWHFRSTQEIPKTTRANYSTIAQKASGSAPFELLSLWSVGS